MGKTTIYVESPGDGWSLDDVVNDADHRDAAAGSEQKEASAADVAVAPDPAVLEHTDSSLLDKVKFFQALENEPSLWGTATPKLTPIQHLAKTARGVKQAGKLRRLTRHTESARSLLTHEPHDMLKFYDTWSGAKLARRKGGWKGLSLRALPYVWPGFLGGALATQLTTPMSVLAFTCSLWGVTIGAQVIWIKCRQLSYIVDVTDDHCLSDADACHKWVRRVSGFLKVMILLMIFVATPVEVAGVAYVAHDVIGWWIAAVPIGVLYAASHVAGATLILGALVIVMTTSIVGCYAYQWWAETALCILREHKEFTGGDKSIEERAGEFRAMDVNGDGTIGIDEYLLLQGRMKANKLREALSTAETSARSYNEHVNKLMGVGITLLLFGGGTMTLACVMICAMSPFLITKIIFGYLVLVCFSLMTVLMLAAAGPGEVHVVSLRHFNTIENYFVDGLAFDLIQIYLNNLELGMRISGSVVTFSTVVSVLSTLLLSVGLTFWGGSG